MLLDAAGATIPDAYDGQAMWTELLQSTGARDERKLERSPTAKKTQAMVQGKLAVHYSVIKPSVA